MNTAQQGYWYTAGDTTTVAQLDAHIAHEFDRAIDEEEAGEDDKRETDTTIADVLEDYEL